MNVHEDTQRRRCSWLSDLASKVPISSIIEELSIPSMHCLLPCYGLWLSQNASEGDGHMLRWHTVTCSCCSISQSRRNPKEPPVNAIASERSYRPDCCSCPVVVRTWRSLPTAPVRASDGTRSVLLCAPRQYLSSFRSYQNAAALQCLQRQLITRSQGTAL